MKLAHDLYFPVTLELSAGAALGLPWIETTRAVAAQIVAEADGPLTTAAWLARTQCHARQLVRLAWWLRMPAHTAGAPLALLDCFLAFLTLGDALTLTLAAAALHAGGDAATARSAYARRRPSLPTIARHDSVLIGAAIHHPDLLTT